MTLRILTVCSTGMDCSLHNHVMAPCEHRPRGPAVDQHAVTRLVNGTSLTRGMGTAAAPSAPRRKATWLVSSRLISVAMACVKSQRVLDCTVGGAICQRSQDSEQPSRLVRRTGAKSPSMPNRANEPDDMIPCSSLLNPVLGQSASSQSSCNDNSITRVILTATEPVRFAISQPMDAGPPPRRLSGRPSPVVAQA